MIQRNFLFYGAWCDDEMPQLHKEDPEQFLPCVEAHIYDTITAAELAGDEFAKEAGRHKGAFYNTTIEPLSPIFVLDQNEIDLIKKLTNRIDTDIVNSDDLLLIKSLRRQIEEWNNASS